MPTSERPVALTTPTVTVWSSPNGLPIAIAHSPTRRASESPSVATVGAAAGSNRITAKPVFVSAAARGPADPRRRARRAGHLDRAEVDARGPPVVGDGDEGRLERLGAAVRPSARRGRPGARRQQHGVEPEAAAEQSESCAEQQQGAGCPGRHRDPVPPSRVDPSGERNGSYVRERGGSRKLLQSWLFS